MKKTLPLLILFLLTFEIMSQNSFDYGLCKFDFNNYERENFEFTSLDSITDFVADSTDEKIKELLGCFYQNISFVKGQRIEVGSKYSSPNFKKYYNKRFNDELNFIYNIPAYELIYRFYGTKINRDYCFNIYTDIKGKIIGHEDILPTNKSDCKLIDEETAKSIVANKWKNQQDKIYIQFGFYKEQKCFAWLLTRLIESENNGYLGTSQTFVINAQNGKIEKREKKKILYE